MYQALKYIHENIKEELVLSEVAEKFGYSKWHFCSKFQKYTGRSFSKYVRHFRLQLAAFDILEGGKISEIALEYGYESTGGFNKMRSKVESLEKMGELLDRAAQVSGKLACLMYDGNIQTNPYKKVMSSCEHCDYKSVCRIDRKNENIRYTWEEVL